MERRLTLLLVLALPAACSDAPASEGGNGDGDADGAGAARDAGADASASPALDGGRTGGDPADTGGSSADATDGGPGDDGGCACEHGPCVRREKDPPTPRCHTPCGAGSACPAGSLCLAFPGGPRCLPAGDAPDGRFCNAADECAGGLCIWSGGGAALCTSECAGPDDASCGDGHTCLPSLTPPGAFHCYPTGDLETGADCLRREHECVGGYCLGQGVVSYCSEQCLRDGGAAGCPDRWGCMPHEGGTLCCDPERSPPGACLP